MQDSLKSIFRHISRQRTANGYQGNTATMLNIFNVRWIQQVIHSASQSDFNCFSSDPLLCKQPHHAPMHVGETAEDFENLMLESGATLATNNGHLKA